MRLGKAINHGDTADTVKINFINYMVMSSPCRRVAVVKAFYRRLASADSSPLEAA